MQTLIHPLEKLIEVITYQGVEFEVVERPDVIWVGCVDYAKDNVGEPDTSKILKRYQKLVKAAPKNEPVNEDWSAALSINFSCTDQPSGMMFANECYTDKQNKRYDLMTQPGGLWLRARVCEEADTALFGRSNHGGWEYFGALEQAAQENGYRQNPDVHMQIEYHCHAEYGTPPHTSYAYIPIVRV